MKKEFLCPICKAQANRQDKCFPFCSERCRTIDLGHWADGSYSIAGEPVPEHDDGEEHRIH